jgi:multidrug resistance protein, MATE family
MNDVRVPTILMFTSYWVFGITLAYVFGFKLGHGHVGVWSGLAFSVAATGIGLTYRFELTSRRRLRSP